MVRDPQFSTWPSEKAILADLLRNSPGKYAVEIGCFRGVTSLHLANVCKEVGKKLICIDPWNNAQDWADESVYYYFLETVAPVKDHIVTIRALSFDALKLFPVDSHDDVGFVFVDGDHSYEGTLKDLTIYYELLMRGGSLAVHDVFDTGWAGVGKALDTFAQPGMQISYSKYIPTKQEMRDYQHGISGLAWVKKI